MGPGFLLCSHFYGEIVPAEIMLMSGDIVSFWCILATVNDPSTRHSDHSKVSGNFTLVVITVFRLLLLKAINVFAVVTRALWHGAIS